MFFIVSYFLTGFVLNSLVVLWPGVLCPCFKLSVDAANQISLLGDNKTLN